MPSAPISIAGSPCMTGSKPSARAPGRAARSRPTQEVRARRCAHVGTSTSWTRTVPDLHVDAVARCPTR